MKSAFKFIAGNSRVTPAGTAIAAILALTLQHALGFWVAPLYIAALLVTLAISTFEPV